MESFNSVVKRLNALTVLLAAFGFVLLLVGLTTKVSVPGLHDLAATSGTRLWSLILGAALVLSALVVSYLPPGQPMTIEASPAKPTALEATPALPAEGEPAIPPEFTVNVLQRLTDLSPRQREIFDVLRSHHGASWVMQDAVSRQFSYSPSELWYRLEQLRLLCLVDRREAGSAADGKPAYSYRVSEAFADARTRAGLPSTAPMSPSSPPPSP